MLSAQKKVGLTIGISAFLVAVVNFIDLTVGDGYSSLRSFESPLVYTLLLASFIPLLTAIRDSNLAKVTQVLILIGLGLVATAINQLGDLTGVVLVAFGLVLGVQYDLLGARLWPRLGVAIVLYGIFAILAAGYLSKRPLISSLNYLIAAAGFLYLFWVVFAEEVRNRRKNEAKLRESEVRFETVIRNSSIMATNQDRELRYTWIYNPHSFLPADSVGKKDYDLFPREEAQRLSALKLGVLESGRGAHDELHWQVGGRERYFDFTVEPLRDALGAIVGVNTASRDVTERVLLRDRLVRSERLATTGQLATYVAHEVNSPLQGIASLLDYLRKRYASDADLKEGLDLVSGAFSSIGATVKNLLDLNRPLLDRFSNVDLNGVITKTFALTASMLKQNGVRVCSKLARGALPVNGQAQRLTQVFINLINNAVEAMQRRDSPESYEKQIEVSTSTDGRNAVVRFADSGPGFSEEGLRHLFDPFHTEKAAVGMGVGLTICLQIVEGMYGTIEIANREKGGACVTITIPSLAADGDAPPGSTPYSSSDRSTSSFSKL